MVWEKKKKKTSLKYDWRLLLLDKTESHGPDSTSCLIYQAESETTKKPDRAMK